MRVSVARGLVITLVIAFAGWTAHGPQAQQQQQGQGQGGQRQGQQGQGGPQVNDHRATKEQLDGWMTQLSNWGRWGKDDQLGAVNLITPAKRKQALALAKTGTVVSLAHDLITDKAVTPNAFVYNLDVQPNAGFVMEWQNISYHGTVFSHLDALCHVAYNGKHYNGVALLENASKESGCSKMGIGGLRDKIVTRGILLDIPRLKGLPYLEPRTHVYREDVEAWEKQAGVKVSAGDAIFLRTGRWARPAGVGAVADFSGFDASFAPFLKERDVALIGSDTFEEVGSVPGFPLPIHRIALVALGVNLFDNLDLEAVAETAARLKRWEFLLMATPLALPKGAGSPISPVAVF